MGIWEWCPYISFINANLRPTRKNETQLTLNDFDLNLDATAENVHSQQPIEHPVEEVDQKSVSVDNSKVFTPLISAITMGEHKHE